MKSDILLLAAAKKMNEEALVAIFDLYNRSLYNYAFRLCNDASLADQIVGDVFSKFIDQLLAGHGPTINLRSYLYEIAYHVFIEEKHFARHVTPGDGIGLAYGESYSNASSIQDRKLMKIVLRAISNDLTDDQRQVIILRFLEGFSLKETAAIIGKTVGNVKVIQTRGIAVLRKALDYQVVETRAISVLLRSMAHV